MFVDEANVKLRAGKGGNGCASFHRAKFLPKGGPNGGDGGRGGSVVLVCDENTGDLIDYFYRPIWEAENGENGMGSDCHGRGGRDCRLKVPPGTIVYLRDGTEPLAELLHHGEELILLKGGSGGWGNLHYKSSINQAPRRANPGRAGEAGEYRFVLKTIAEVGLVGYPNAGKSTLTGMITRARPKTGPYPFTTLHPHVGVVDYPERYDTLRLADIPGLIEGAHQNRGLGHRFLRHIERCHLLLLLIDMAGTDGRDPRDDYRHLLEELGLYSPALLEKPRLVVANKMDEPAAADHLADFRADCPVEILPVSCLLGEGLPELKERIYRAKPLPPPPVLPTLPPSPSEEATKDTP